MAISINVFILTAVLAAAVFFGFFAGRMSVRRNREDAPADEFLRGKDRRRDRGGRSWSVGSPVTGTAAVFREGGKTGVVIRPMEDKLYAPTGGKITKLYPMGNAFLFQTEFGAELYIRAGSTGDELLGRYYRPRIVQNEIVNKGKLLLEFDRQGLESEGESPEVSVCVESCIYGGEVIMTAEGQVKTGEEILLVREATESDDTHPGSRNIPDEIP